MQFKVSLTGMDAVKKLLDRKEKAATVGLDKEMTAFALQVNAKQKRYTPVDTGQLRQGNVVDTSGYLDKKIANTKKYGPWVEFGTGQFVDVPAGLEDYAIQFKGKGIKQVNMHSQSFFFRAYFEELTKFVQRLQQLLKTA